MQQFPITILISLGKCTKNMGSNSGSHERKTIWSSFKIQGNYENLIRVPAIWRYVQNIVYSKVLLVSV